MTLHRGDKEFRHEGISYLDYKQIDMERVLTAFLPRLWWRGQRSVINRERDLELDDFVAVIQENPDLYGGFDVDTTRRWVETHLLDVTNRGKANQTIAGLRPLHGFTYRFRNARRSRPYGADEQLYAMLKHGGSTTVLETLKAFFFDGIDGATATAKPSDQIDVETQALISLSEAVKDRIGDRRAQQSEPIFRPPLYARAAGDLAMDTVRLLFHREHIPRSVLVEYLKILFAFHLALYHLKITKLLPALIKGDSGPAADGFFLDVVDLPGTPTALLAERSATRWYDRIPDFVRATFTVRKLDDFAENLAKRNKLRRPRGGFFDVPDLLALLGPKYNSERNQFGLARLNRVLDSAQEERDELGTEISQLLDLGLDDFTTYIEIITAYRVGFHHKYLRECLDSLLLKNRPGAMIAQPRLGRRRFVLDSRLLEVLLQINLLEPGGERGFHTASLRVDDFLAILRERYGLHIDTLPPDDGFDRPSITDQAALRANGRAFVDRLREIGFYSDLSDAYVTQTITPRHVIDK
jgi:hypothetical protein